MKKVLIVDDEPNIVMALEYAFRKEKFEVLIARNGGEAFELMKEHVPEMVVMDIMMPLVNGYETLKMMKQEKQLKDIKVILLSAKNKTTDIEYGLKLGANDYITKPFSVKKLINRVHELMPAE